MIRTRSARPAADLVWSAEPSIAAAADNSATASADGIWEPILKQSGFTNKTGSRAAWGLRFLEVDERQFESSSSATHLRKRHKIARETKHPNDDRAAGLGGRWDGENWWSCRGTAPRVRNRKTETSQASWISPCGTLTRIALPVQPAGFNVSLEPVRQQANVCCLSRACGRRVTAGMGGLPASPSRPKSARTRSRQACAFGPTGWRVLEC